MIVPGTFSVWYGSFEGRTCCWRWDTSYQCTGGLQGALPEQQQQHFLEECWNQNGRPLKIIFIEWKRASGRTSSWKQASAALQGELEDLKKKSEEADEKLARTQKELEEYKKLTEKNNQAMEENNALLRRILALNNGNSS